MFRRCSETRWRLNSKEMPCLFCKEEFDEEQGRKRTREHVFAEWMAPFLKSPEGPGGGD